MTISGEDISRVTNLLKLRPRGMSIAAIVKELHLNRNSVAKYLDLLTASGAVELTRVGPAKLYFTAPRVPVSGMINLSSDYFIMLDTNLRVLYVNNHVLEFEERTRPEVLQKKLDDLSFTLVADDAIAAYLHSTERDEMFQREVEVRKGEETFHFRVKIISTVYENGSQGLTILATDITTEKEQEMALRASEAEYRGVVEDQSELIFRFRPDRIFTFANDAFLRVIGKRREEVVGVPATFPVLDEDMVKIRKAYGSLTMDHDLPQVLGGVNIQGKIEGIIYSPGKSIVLSFLKMLEKAAVSKFHLHSLAGT
jgi:PAS domain-containing protein